MQRKGNARSGWKRTKTPGIYVGPAGTYKIKVRDSRKRLTTRTAKTYAEARRLKPLLVADAARGEDRIRSSITFGQYAPGWVSSYRGRTSRGFREATRREYARDLEKDAIPFFGRMKLSAIEPQDVKAYLQKLADRGLSPASLRNALAPVRALLADAVEEGLIRSNPASRVRLPITDMTTDPRIKAMTEEELRKLLAEIPDDHRLFFELLAHTGVRVGEAIALRWADIDFGQRRLHVRRAIRNGEVVPPKSRYGVRTIRLSDRMTQALLGLRRRTRFPAVDDPVFASQAGTPIDPDNLRRRVLRPAAQRAGVPWVSFHAFRHTNATLLLRNGATPKQVQLALGHNSAAFTLDRYVHLLSDDLANPAFMDRVTSL